MNTATVARHAIGYAIGISLVFLLIPYGIITLSRAHWFTGTVPYLSHLPVGDGVRLASASILAALGLLFGAWSNLALLIRGKGGPTDAFNIAISPRTRHLVTTGPYRYTRNPMVFGALTFYLALAIYLDSPAAIALLVLCFIGVRFYLRATEEKRLRRDFGPEYESYRGSVPTIVPRPWKRRISQ